jgi:hypothetical protein
MITPENFNSEQREYLAWKNQARRDARDKLNLSEREAYEVDAYFNYRMAASHHERE